jgi:hypothetical protein
MTVDIVCQSFSSICFRSSCELYARARVCVCVFVRLRVRMARDIRFIHRSLFNGLREINALNRVLAPCSFLLILVISSVIPLAIVWLLQSFILSIVIIPITSPWLSTLITLWSIVEVTFLIYQAYLYAIIQERQRSPPPLTSIERNRLVSSAFSHIKSLPDTLSKWFFDRPFEDIDRSSLIGWLAFAFYSKESQELHAEEYQDIDRLINRIEHEHHVNVSNRRTNERVNYMKHILDPVQVIVRPFVYYLVTDTLLNGILATSMFYLRGYQHVRIGHLQFWTYYDQSLNNNNKQEEKEPIIFFHGIGAGLLMYQPFIARVHRQFSLSRRIIFISMPCICMRYPSLTDIVDMSKTIDSIHRIFQYYRFTKAIFIGHR